MTTKTGGDPERQRLMWQVWHETVTRLGDAEAGGLMPGQLERVRQDLLPGGIWEAGTVPPEDEPIRLRLLEQVCEGLAAQPDVAVPDYAPEDDADPRGARSSTPDDLATQSQSEYPPALPGGSE